MRKDDHKVRGDYLVAAFQDAWLRALNDERITSNNIDLAPAELMEAVLVSLADVADQDARTLGRAAFARWHTQPEVGFDEVARAAGEPLH